MFFKFNLHYIEKVTGEKMKREFVKEPVSNFIKPE